MRKLFSILVLSTIILSIILVFFPRNNEIESMTVLDITQTIPTTTQSIIEDNNNVKVKDFKNINEEALVEPMQNAEVVKVSEEDYILAKINDYRVGLGLYPVVANSSTCEFAALRARELVDDFSHDGFTQRVDAGSLPYSTYSKITENIAMHYDYTKVVSEWAQSSGHAENMRAETPYVCVKKYGDYYAYEGMHP